MCLHPQLHTRPCMFTPADSHQARYPHTHSYTPSQVCSQFYFLKKKKSLCNIHITPNLTPYTKFFIVPKHSSKLDQRPVIMMKLWTQSTGKVNQGYWSLLEYSLVILGYLLNSLSRCFLLLDPNFYTDLILCLSHCPILPMCGHPKSDQHLIPKKIHLFSSKALCLAVPEISGFLSLMFTEKSWY